MYSSNLFTGALNRLKSFTFRKLRGLPLFSKVYTVALIGKPGTGKSFYSQRIATELNLEVIIDDGLRIKDSVIICGRSAKSEETKIAATKTAIFFDQIYCASVRDCIRKNKITSTLILGTSLKMADRIAHQLHLGGIDKIIRIEDMLTSNEIQMARSQRKKLGRHIIPVPAMEIRKWYPAIFFDSIQMIIHKYLGAAQKTNFENSIVRPKFGEHYNISISENAIRQMIMTIIHNVNNTIVVRSMKIKWVRCDACKITLNVALCDINNSTKDMLRISENIKSLIQNNIGLIIEKVDIAIDSQEQMAAEFSFPP